VDPEEIETVTRTLNGQKPDFYSWNESAELQEGLVAWKVTSQLKETFKS
jgi:hypothetical protein